MGVSDPRMLPLVAEVLARRGVRPWCSELDPEDVGLPRADPDALLGGDVERNVVIARAALRGPGSRSRGCRERFRDQQDPQ